MGTGTVAPLTFDSGTKTQTTIDKIEINIQGGAKDPRQIAREVVDELRVIARAQTGDTNDWGGLK